jgi:hypothetical protein
LGGGGYVVHHWPIEPAGYCRPELNVIVRVGDDGEIFVAIEEDWDLMTDD